VPGEAESRCGKNIMLDSQSQEFPAHIFHCVKIAKGRAYDVTTNPPPDNDGLFCNYSRSWADGPEDGAAPLAKFWSLKTSTHLLEFRWQIDTVQPQEW
jgi:hypothetical protein